MASCRPGGSDRALGESLWARGAGRHAWPGPSSRGSEALGEVPGCSREVVGSGPSRAPRGVAVEDGVSVAFPLIWPLSLRTATSTQGRRVLRDKNPETRRPNGKRYEARRTDTGGTHLRPRRQGRAGDSEAETQK